MMKNRAPRGRGQQMGAGSGLLGEGPGMRRMMAGVGAGGLLGNAPAENRMHQPRSLMERPDMSGGIRQQANMRGSLLEQPNLRDRQGYSHGGRLEESADRGYYDEGGADYIDGRGAYRQEYQDLNVGAFDQVRDDPYGSQDDSFAYNYNQQSQEVYQAQVGTQRGLLQDPQSRGQEQEYRHEDISLRQDERGLRHQEQVQRQRLAGGFDVRGLLETPAEQRGLLRNPSDQRGSLNQPREQQGWLSDRNQRGLFDQPREHGFMESVHEQQGLLEIPGLDMHAEQQGLLDYPRDQPRGLMEPPSIMDIPEPPRPPRSLMDVRNEPRGLMDTPVEPRGLMDTGRDQRSFMDNTQQRGNRGQQQRGLLDTPRDTRAPMSPNQQNNRNRPRTKQSELMEKADLQLKLLQQEKMMEMEQMEQMNLLKQQQQALLLQQQQHLQQHQQLQQQLQIKQQMQQAEIIMNASKGQQRSPGVIPSLFDVPTSRANTSLGKRSSAPVRTSENKRAKSGPADRRERPLLQGRKEPTSRDRLGGRRNDRNNRNRRGRKLTRTSSPDRKGRDRRVSDSRDGSSKKSTPSRDRNERGDKGKDRRNDRGKDKNEKADSKEKPKTEVTVTMGDEKYDPAEPTEDIEIQEDKEEKKDESSEKMDTEENKESKDVEIKEQDKEGDQKPKEISLTVTVNKKGRSVNDVDQDDTKKPNREKLYKCNICSVSCFDEASFSRHMNGKKHGEKMKIVMSSTTHQTELIKSRLQAEEHLRQIESQKRSSGKLGPTGNAGPKGKALETLCKVCKKNFTGAYKEHKESPDHKAKEDRSKAGCKICKVSTFSTYDAFTKHLQSVWHRKNKKKLNSEDDDEEISDLVTLDTVGFDDDSNAEKKEKEMETDATFAKPLEASTPVPKSTEKPMKAESLTPVKAGLFTQKSETQTPSKVDEEDVEIPDTYDPTLALGQKYVVPVSGYFCKLCHKFYNNESAAKVAHCQSETHFEKLKKAVAAKLLKTKKKEATQPQSGDSGTSQSKEMKNGNQEVDDSINMEEQSQGDAADENDDGSQEEEGENNLDDIESKDKESEIDSSEVEVKRSSAKRGGLTPRGVARARRGRK